MLLNDFARGWSIVWWNAYFCHVRKWRNAYRRVGGGQVAHGLRTVIGCCKDRRRRRRRWTDLSRDSEQLRRNKNDAAE